MPPESRQISRYISPAAQASMREVIAECGGAEVFFVGRPGPHGVIEEAEPCAFGNQEAVPVIEHMASPGHVVIHNHPGGNLEPSQADIEVASHFGNNGVGSYIVDNAVESLRVIVPAMAPQERQELLVSDLEALLEPGGLLARSMAQFEDRPQQKKMLRTVAEMFNQDGIGVIEAGTGVGKSLAYLIPAIHWAVRNGEKVVVSTNTINLQEQLILKDLPFLQRRLNLKFKAELMKGRQNYLCKRKAAYLRATPDFFSNENLLPQLQEMLEWAEKTADGSLSDLGFIPDYDAWEQVACDPDNCTRIKCPHYTACFFFQARRRAAAADLIVANHHLVMADLAVRRETGNYTSTAVLPAYRRIVFDEAHNIEDVATRYFGICITRRVLSRLLFQLMHRQRSHMGLLPFLRDRLALLDYRIPSPATADAVRLIESELIPLRQNLSLSVEQLMHCCAQGVRELTGKPVSGGSETQVRITEEIESSRFWKSTLREALRETTEQMQRLAAGLKQVRSALLGLPEKERADFENPAGELQSLSGRLLSRVDEFRHFYTIGKDRCRWMEARAARGAGAEPLVRLYSLPLEVQEDLHQAVFARTPTVLLTSATLSVDKKFDFFLGQVGLDGTHGDPATLERLTTLYLCTPFDYERQAFVGVPMDLPDPREADFTSAAAGFLLPALQISKGSAFVLFTSYRQMDLFYDRLAPAFQALGYTCLKQGTENRQALLQRFRNDRAAILFATSSFWEGVDVPGDALRLLVLVKLPFRVPSDPLVEARVERLQMLGEDAFSNYSVPQAVIKFKQGFGRLIRTREDRGAVLILDRRVITKRYGQVFLRSLPSGTVHDKPSLDILEDLRAFFARR